MNYVRDLLLVLILILVLSHALIAMFWPTNYGHWLQHIDSARYDMVDQGE